MAFKFKTFAAVGALIGSLALVGCGQDEKDPNHIKVGVIVGTLFYPDDIWMFCQTKH